VARSAGELRSLYYLLQSLCALAQGWRLGPDYGCPELPKIERFNQLIASAEWRRIMLLREIDRRRAIFAQKVRGEIYRIETAESKTIEVESIAPTQAANENAA
jgi:hypothetical protein